MLHTPSIEDIGVFLSLLYMILGMLSRGRGEETAQRKTAESIPPKI
jgi:hypothetical protein